MVVSAGLSKLRKDFCYPDSELQILLCCSLMQLSP